MGETAMKWRAKLIIFEPFDAEEEIIGDLINFFWFKSEDGRVFRISPRGSLFEFIPFLKGKEIVIISWDKWSIYLGTIKRL
jgi:hypothetical protein